MSRGPKHLQNDAVPMEQDEIHEVPERAEIPMGPNKDAEEYPMDNRPRGRVIIFNHSKFHSNLKLGERSGTHSDKQRLKEIFSRLEFEVNDDDVCDDYKFEQIRNKLEQVASEDHSRANCIVIVVMTHGEGTDIEKQKMSRLYAFDQGYHETELWQHFLGDVCPSLRGKPKLIFIQACRGNEKEKGCLLQSTKAHKEGGEASYEEYSIPNTADILVAHSSTQGCKSYRHPTTGAVFIQKLCDQLETDIGRENSEKKDLMSILLKVNNQVAQVDIREEDDDDDEPPCKQMSWVEISLTRQIYFRNLD